MRHDRVMSDDDTRHLPSPVSRDDVLEAARRLGSRVRRTPLLEAEAGLLGEETVLLKLEHLQHTGSFKARGALTALLSAQDIPSAGVVAASGGNHGLAVAWSAGQVGTVATIFVPRTAPPAKVRGLRALGADVRLIGERYAQALAAAREHERSSGSLAVHAYDEPAVVAGQGTVGAELLDQTGMREGPTDQSLDTVLVAVGGGGLVGGIAAALDGRAQVVGVEPEGCPTWHAALAAGGPVDVEVGGIGADALGATRLGGIAWETLSRARAASVLVDSDAVISARRFLWERLRLAVEPGAAVAVAALLSGRYVPQSGERVAVIICGANADPSDLSPPVSDPGEGMPERGSDTGLSWAAVQP